MQRSFIHFEKRGNSIMKIRIAADNKLFHGTPTEIVRRMRDTDHQNYPVLDDYIQHCRTRLEDLLGDVIDIRGLTEEERCASFLERLVAIGHARLEVRAPEDVDKHVVFLLRKILGLSQERFARKIGVTFATVNRWERGRSQPNSTAISDRLNKVAQKVLQLT
jgi:DNA-binding transcriptional regulator YiaG